VNNNRSLENIKTMHPHINAYLRKYIEEDNKYNKLRRLIDLFEMIIKTNVAIAMGEYFKAMDNNPSDEIKISLAAEFITPTLGKWVNIGRKMLEEIEKKPPEEFTREQFDTLVEHKFNEVYSSKQNKEQAEKARDSIIAKLEEFYEYKVDKYVLKKEPEDTRFVRSLGHRYIIENFYKYYSDFDKKYLKQKFKKDGEEFDNLIALRNEVAHGPVYDEESCEKYINIYEPILVEILLKDIFTSSSIIVFVKDSDDCPKIVDLDGVKNEFVSDEMLKVIRYTYKDSEVLYNTPYLINSNNALLSLSPIMMYPIPQKITGKNHDKDILVFYNDLKSIDDDKVGIISYPNSYINWDSDLYNREIKNSLNIKEWKKVSLIDIDLFKDRRNALITNFRGRDNEVGEFKKWLKNHNKGFVFIEGDSGIGKSAFMTKLIDELKFSDDFDWNMHVIDYYIESSSRTSELYYFYEYMKQELDKICYKSAALLKSGAMDIPLGSVSDNKEMELKYAKRLEVISHFVDKPIIIFIDALDQSEAINNSLKNDLYENIIFVISSKPNNSINISHIRNSAQNLHIPLKNLEKYTVRALVEEVIDDKYELFEKVDYHVENIIKKVDGNSLCLSFLLDSFRKKEVDFSNYIEKLPTGLIGYYNKIYDSLKAEDSLCIEILYILCAGRDYLSIEQISLIVQRDINAVKSVVYRKLNTILKRHASGSERYQLFHDSLREYLKSKSDIEAAGHYLQKANYFIACYCSRWVELCNNKLYDFHTRSYPFKYYSKHLMELNDKEIYSLVDNYNYMEEQIEATGGYYYYFEICKDAMSMALINEDTVNVNKMLLMSGNAHLQLHKKRIQDIIHVENWSDNNLNNLLQDIDLFNQREQFILFINLIYQITGCNYMLEGEKKSALEKVTLKFDESFNSGKSLVNWCSFISPVFMVELLTEVFKYNQDKKLVSSIINGGRLEFCDEEEFNLTIEALLQEEKFCCREALKALFLISEIFIGEKRVRYLCRFADKLFDYKKSDLSKHAIYVVKKIDEYVNAFNKHDYEYPDRIKANCIIVFSAFLANRRYFKEAAAQLEKISAVYSDIRCSGYLDMADILLKVGHVKHGIRFIKKVFRFLDKVREDIQVQLLLKMCSIASCLPKSKLSVTAYRKALKKAYLMETDYERSFTFSYVADYLIPRSELGALSLINYNISETEFRYRALAKLYASYGKVKEALELADRVRDFGLSSSILYIIFNTLCDNLMFDKNEIIQLIDSIESFPNENSFYNRKFSVLQIVVNKFISKDVKMAKQALIRISSYDNAYLDGILSKFILNGHLEAAKELAGEAEIYDSSNSDIIKALTYDYAVYKRSINPMDIINNLIVKDVKLSCKKFTMGRFAELKIRKLIALCDKGDSIGVSSMIDSLKAYTLRLDINVVEAYEDELIELVYFCRDELQFDKDLQQLRASLLNKLNEYLNKPLYDYFGNTIEEMFEENNIEGLVEILNVKLNSKEEFSELNIIELAAISTQCHKAGYEEAAEKIIDNITYIVLDESFYFKEKSLAYIYLQLLEQSKTEKAEELLQYLFSLLENPPPGVYKRKPILDVVWHFMRAGKIDETLELIIKLKLSGNDAVEVIEEMTKFNSLEVLRKIIGYINNEAVSSLVRTEMLKVLAENLYRYPLKDLRTIGTIYLEVVHNKDILSALLFLYADELAAFRSLGDKETTKVLKLINEIIDISQLLIREPKSYTYENFDEWFSLTQYVDKERVEYEKWRVDQGRSTVEEFNSFILKICKDF
jgi:hypothetical protein